MIKSLVHLWAVAREQRTRATGRGEVRDGRVCVEVADDGRGGATTAGGSGLRGLADRVDALDGRLTITSAQQAGTALQAELPCQW